MKTRVRTITSEQEFRSPKYQILNSHILTPVAELANQLCERWGMVCAVPDGEDSSGQAKLRIMTPDEVVQRSFETAERFFAQAAERGHMAELPDLDAAAEKKTASIAA